MHYLLFTFLLPILPLNFSMSSENCSADSHYWLSKPSAVLFDLLYWIWYISVFQTSHKNKYSVTCLESLHQHKIVPWNYLKSWDMMQGNPWNSLCKKEGATWNPREGVASWQYQVFLQGGFHPGIRTLQNRAPCRWLRPEN